MYTHLAQVYSKLGWGKFSKDLAKKLKPFLKKWRVQTHYDLACGTGIFVKEMSILGINSSGLDISKEMIKVAKFNYPHLKFRIGNMINFKLNKPVDFITCNYDSINHLLTFREWEAVFRGVFNNLTRNGRFLFDINTLNKINNLNITTYVSKNSYVLIKRTNSVGNNKCIFAIKWFWRLKNGLYKCYREIIRETSFPYQKIKRSLKRAGFRKINILFAENRNSDKKRLYILATKN